MIIIGHRYIEYDPLYFIKEIEDIKNTPPNSTLIFEFNEKNIPLAKHCQKNGIDFAIIADTKRELYFANLFDPKYIICDKNAILVAQKFADDYIIDAKILLYSSDEKDLDFVASNAIDGILFEEAIDYGSC